MKVLITGANGFVGRHTLPILQGLGADIFAVSRQTISDKDGVTWIQADLLQSSDLVDVITSVKPTHLLHFAWDVTPGKYWTSLANFQWVRSSLQLLEQFHQHGGKRAVFAGTCAEYDWQYGYLTEDVTPLDADTPYATSKISLYQMFKSYAEQTGLSYAWGRIFFPFGSYENPNRLIPYVIQSLLNNEVAETTSGMQIRDFLYVKDYAEAFVALLQSDVQGAVNIASGDPIRMKDVILSIADSLKKHDLVNLGARPDGDQPPMIVADIKRLRDEVGWQPKFTISQGLQETIQWWQQST